LFSGAKGGCAAQGCACEFKVLGLGCGGAVRRETLVL